MRRITLLLATAALALGGAAGAHARGNEITWENRGSALLEPTDEPGRLIGLWLAARIREHWQRVDVWHHVDSNLNILVGKIRNGVIDWAEQ